MGPDVTNDVRITKMGEEADQTVRFYLDDNGQVAEQEEKVSRTTRADYKEEAEKELDKLKLKYQKVMKYKEFALSALLEQVPVKVTGYETIQGVQKVIFNYKGKEYRIAITFINK